MTTTITALSILGTSHGGSATAATATATVLGFAAQNANTGNSGSGGVFGALADASVQNTIQNILTTGQAQASKTALYANIANYLSALQSGQIQPSGNWQLDAAYLQQTGQPFVVTLDNKGQPQITPEASANLSRYNPAEQLKLARALQQVATMAQKIQANKTNQSWLDTLNSVEPMLQAFKGGYGLPAQGWQTQAANMQATGQPFKIVLDAKGNVSVQDQFNGQFADASPVDQPKLMAAAAQLQSALQTGITPLAWEAQAYNDAQQKQDYYLDVDPVTGGIVVKNNGADNIVPSFLKTAPYPDIGANTPWLKQAATDIHNGTGFYLDIGGNGQIMVRQNNAQGIATFNQPRNTATQNPIINLLT